jgi:DNA-directed RNA polymerase subunit RPC12/RpoP
MTVQLICPWCQDEVAFSVSEAEDEIVCEACSTRMPFAPDPSTTFGLLYGAAA